MRPAKAYMKTYCIRSPFWCVEGRQLRHPQPPGLCYWPGRPLPGYGCLIVFIGIDYLCCTKHTVKRKAPPGSTLAARFNSPPFCTQHHTTTRPHSARKWTVRPHNTVRDVLHTNISHTRSRIQEDSNGLLFCCSITPHPNKDTERLHAYTQRPPLLNANA